MAVNFTELQGSPDETWTDERFSATRRLKCAWASRKTLAEELLETEYPLIADTSAYCRQVSITPHPGKNTGSGDESAYDYAIVTATWETSEIEDLVSESLEPTAEFERLDHKLFRWENADGDALEKDEAPGRLIRGLEYVKTRYKQASVPAAALSLIGCVNQAAVSPVTPGLTGLSFAAETLLYQPPMLNRTIKTDGTGLWTITYRFTYRPNWDGATARGWNWYWWPAAQAYKQIYSLKTSSVYVNYPTGDFTAL